MLYRALSIAIACTLLIAPCEAVETEVLKELKARTDVEHQSRGLSSVIAATQACGHAHKLPSKDIITIRGAYAQADEEAYIRGSQQGAIDVRKRGFKAGSRLCQSAIPTIYRGLRGIVGTAKALRELGFE